MDERTKLVIGDKIKKIKKLNILLIGLGGVGGYVLESLVRLGIENITIIDGDIIDKTNLNRQIISNKANIGNKKVDEWQKRINTINPECNIKAINKFLTPNDVNDLDFNYDYIIDACDSSEVKVSLIKKQYEQGFKLISSMGMGNKINANDIKIVSLHKTTYDPLAKKIRNELRKQGIKSKIPVVSSTEIPLIRSNKIGSVSYIPAIAGLLITDYIVKEVLNN